MILGISASGRGIVRDDHGLLLKGATEDLVKFVIKNTGEPYEYISLGGKKIVGCQGCLECASDNICKVDDEWGQVMEKVFESDALVFGAPIYYGTINALGHAFLERLFSLRHRDKFRLLGKPNVILTVGREEQNDAEEYIRKIFKSNYMAEPIGVLRSRGVSQCYTCGFGERCAAGSVVARHGFVDEIRGYHFPRIPSETYKSAQIIAKRLGEAIKQKKNLTTEKITMLRVSDDK
jgi:multimeric flavodoxin WrbA